MADRLESANPKAGERRNVTLAGNVSIGEGATFTTEGSGTIEIGDGASIQNGVRLIARDGQRIVIGKETTLLAGADTIITGNVSIGDNCEISGRITDTKVGNRTKLHDKPVVTMAQIGNGCHMNGGQIKGYYVEGRGSDTVYDEEGKPINIVVVKDGARLEHVKSIRTVAKKESWRLVERQDPNRAFQADDYPLRGIAVDVKATIIEGKDPQTGKETVINGAEIENAEIGGGTAVKSFVYIASSRVGRRCLVDAHAKLELADLGNDVRCGAEISKAKLGTGTTASHRSGYGSLVAHEVIPLMNEQGETELLDLGANCSLIPATCTFANYRGANDEMGQPIKGTAHFLGPSFVDAGTVIANLGGRPDVGLREINDQDDITVISPFCYLTSKVVGKVLPFTKAGERVGKIRPGKADRSPDYNPRFHEIGWVLDNRIDMILNRLLLLKKYAKVDAFDRLVERTLVDGIMRVKRELAKPKSRYDRYKLMRGLEIYEAHLHSGAWKMISGNFAWGGKLEGGQDFKALEREIKKRVILYREQKQRERFKPIGAWIDMFRNKTNPQIEDELIQIYGDRPEFIEGRRTVIVTALEEAARIFTFNREVCIVRSPARINLCGRGNQDAEDGHMNYVGEGRENIMVVARREGDSNVNLYNATPAFQNQKVSFNIAREIEHAQTAWHLGWNDYINDEVVKGRVEDARSNGEAEWVNVPRGAILNLIHGLGDLGLFYLNVDINGFDALVYSDIPPGGGISSSSALAVSSALAFLEANNLSRVPREAIATSPYEIYTGELGGNGDHGAIMLARLNSIVHLSQMNSTGKPNAHYIKIPDDLQVAIVPSFVSSRKTGEQKVENNKGKFSFKLAVPIIKKILKSLQPQHPNVITDDFIERFNYIGQLNRDTLGPDYEEIIYKILRRLPEGRTTEQLINEYPYPELRALSEKFELTEQKLAEFEIKINEGKPAEEHKHLPREVDLKGPVLFFLAMTERARMFGEYLERAELAREKSMPPEEREILLKRAGELMYIGHNGDRVVVYDAESGTAQPYEARRVTNDMLDKLIAIKNHSVDPKLLEGARLYRQSGFFRASIEELDTVVDAACSLGDEVVLGAAVTGAGFGGNVVVLMRKRQHVDTFGLLVQALARAGALRVAREQCAQEMQVDPQSLPFAQLNIPVSGASVFEIKANYAGGVNTLAVNREVLAGV